MSQVTITPIPAFDDNYIWCLADGSHCVVVDPGDATPVILHCQANQLQLSAILITHHHWDHTNGIAELLSRFGDIPVFGPAKGNTKEVNQPCAEGDVVSLPNLDINLSVLEVPGHTLDHIAYVSDSGVFCGDTLFSGGCGRLFEGTPEQMHNSLQKLAKLPTDFKVYCTHEYTLANLAFARAVEQNNQALNDYSDWAKQQRDKQLPTLPSSIAQEIAINPFLRVAEKEVKSKAEQKLGKDLSRDEEVFAAIRGWKDHF